VNKSHYKDFVIKTVRALAFAKDFGVTPASLPRVDLDCEDVEVRAAVLDEAIHALEVTEQLVRMTMKDNPSKEWINMVEKWEKCARTAIKASKKIWH
jgi:hypothetical protein